MKDVYVMQGAFRVRASLGSSVGNEGVGRVLAVGGGVEHLTVGDRVLVPLYAFSWRERLVVPAAGLFSLSEADPQQLAMLGINPPPASLLLDGTSALKPCASVVPNTPNLGVGTSLTAIPTSSRRLARRSVKPYRSSLPARSRCPSRQPILCPHCAKRFFTPSGAERCFSIFAERADLRSRA